MVYAESMKAVVFDATGDESVLRVAEVPPPALGRGEVRIRVEAAGINRADLLQRRGLYPPPPGASPILGLECAGTILERAPDIAGLQVGERVMALLTGGGYAEEVVAPAGSVMRVPEDLGWAEAGGLPETFLTAFLNLFLLGGLDRGRAALVHGGSGGVGTSAIALCRRAGARVMVTAGSHRRCRRCVELGAERAFDHTEEDFSYGVLEATDGDGVDVVLDCVGAPYLERNLRVLRTEGRLVIIALMGGAVAEVDLATLLRRRLQVTGSTLRGRSDDAKAAIIRAFRERFGGDLDSGSLRPVIHRVVPLADVADAHRDLAGGGVFGKLVLAVR